MNTAVKTLKEALIVYSMRTKLSGKRDHLMELNVRFLVLLDALLATKTQEEQLSRAYVKFALSSLRAFVAYMETPSGPEINKLFRLSLWPEYGNPFWEANFEMYSDGDKRSAFYDVLWHYCCLLDIAFNNFGSQLYNSEYLKLYRDCRNLDSELAMMLASEEDVHIF